MTVKEIKQDLEHNTYHSRVLDAEHVKFVSERQILYNLLANQILIMEALAKLLPDEG